MAPLNLIKLIAFDQFFIVATTLTTYSCLIGAKRDNLRLENWGCGGVEVVGALPCAVTNMADLTTRAGVNGVGDIGFPAICDTGLEPLSCLSAGVDQTHNPALQWSLWYHNGSHYIQEANVTDGTDAQSCTLITRVELFACDFEVDVCGMDQRLLVDNYDWEIHTGPGNVNDTGPQAAHQGDYYVYVFSAARNPGTEAIMLTPELNYYGPVCVKFWYYLYGSQIGSFHVFVLAPDNTQEEIFVRMEEEGEVWLLAKVTTNIERSYKIGFKTIRDGGARGDIAVDSLMITPESCLPDQYN